MDSAVTISSVKSGQRLELRPDGSDYVEACIVGPNLQGAVRAWLYEGPASLVAFFESMADESYGWTETKRWAALEGDLQLDASVDRAGHVTIAIHMRCAHQADPWDITTSIETELGLLLELAKTARRIFKSVV
jgi:hypothetical protein